MNVIEGVNVDLISPFPVSEARRVFGWMHCYRTLTESDDTPNTLEDFIPYFQSILGLCPSWGIIDKKRITNSQHEAPLVGVGLYEPASIRHGFFHVATARKAFKTGLVDEASQLVIKEIFEKVPTLTRIGGYMDEKNAPAKGLCRRMGFKFEGVLEDMVVRNGAPQNTVYYGLTRRRYEEQCRLTKSIQDNSKVSSEVSAGQWEDSQVRQLDLPLDPEPTSNPTEQVSHNSAQV